jgi:radical SAM protein with 4Fe4S-binding SPASM domain
MQSSLVTAGRGFNRERALAAKAAGLQTVSFSVDGDEATHDRLRALDGAYRTAVRGMQLCREIGLPFSVNTQVNRLSLPHLAHVFELLSGAGAHGWQVQLTVPAGRAADEPEVLLQPYDVLILFPILAELKQRADQAKIKFLAGNNLGYFGPYDHVLRELSPCGHSQSCQAGRLGLGIEANGDVKGCPSLPTDRWVGGNTREHPIEQIWERSEPLRYNRDRSVDDLWGFCRTCYYADECRAGCTWMSTSLFGRPGNNPYCHHRALELERKGLRERVVFKRAAPGTPFDYAEFELELEAMPGR